MIGTTEAAQDISFEAMKKKARTGRGNCHGRSRGPGRRLHRLGGGNGSALNNGRMFISLKPQGSGKGERKDDAGTVIARLRGKLSKIPGAQLFLTANQDIRVGGEGRQKRNTTICACPIKTLMSSIRGRRSS